MIKGNLCPVSMAVSGATDMSVAIGAMSDASSDKTVLGNRGGYEDVVVEIPALKDCSRKLGHCVRVPHSQYYQRSRVL